MALSNADVQKQIQHMISFIEQEASEKVQEIEAKATEEFEIEKGRLVQEQRVKIIEYFEKKEKQVELQKRIQASHMLNQTRIKYLKAREEHIKNVLEEARNKLIEKTKDPQVYTTILQKLIAQGLFQLIESQVVIRCRQQDKQLVENAIPLAVDEYKKAIKKECKVTLDTEKFLHHDSCGGVEIYAHGGKIKCTNTLESRLESVSQQLMPFIRVALFGSNPNRKFTD